MLWRQGDVLIESVAEIPARAVLRGGPPILAYGEVTGHAHRIAEPDLVEVWEYGDLYISAIESITIVHDEHGPVTLPPGVYRVWRQREYTPEDPRIIRD
ncbi:MAG TPA: hypothetical protein VMV29_17190 [Ktedonobacterales bacterium]|nr:hypothetical protein [Ktedonobacterales bacterium]